LGIIYLDIPFGRGRGHWSDDALLEKTDLLEDAGKHLNVCSDGCGANAFSLKYFGALI
jgi:hypothetical protein